MIQGLRQYLDKSDSLEGIEKFYLKQARTCGINGH
ncbi:hypothetical protein T11_6181 [Trichinella zimbabwensis]|uniref:Uncharacterized protein n=1 Tax=Trichinella zimbabwensis TaxID=268475 RepID=A0A0V1GDT7_9BILA|nr:hypothetical protein T11_6181 [Trichinella zimbabwensis]